MSSRGNSHVPYRPSSSLPKKSLLFLSSGATEHRGNSRASPAQEGTCPRQANSSRRKVPSYSCTGVARHAAAGIQDLEARGHTTQVPYEVHKDREERFQEGEPPILYCSPMMGFAVDIAELNVVNMRSITPIPAEPYPG